MSSRLGPSPLWAPSHRAAPTRCHKTNAQTDTLQVAGTGRVSLQSSKFTSNEASMFRSSGNSFTCMQGDMCTGCIGEDDINMSSDTTDSNFPQLDGPADHQASLSRARTNHGTEHDKNVAKASPPAMNAYSHLLPYCTTDGQLSDDQCLGLSDVAGNMKEVVLLALAGLLDDDGHDILGGAVGVDTAAAIREFWAAEYVVDA